MKFSVDRDVLADAVAWTARAVPARPPVPVLAGVRIDASADGTVMLSSFDYEVSARGQFAAQVESEGSVLVSGRLLREIANALPHKPVEFVLEGTKVSVTCGASRFTLATMPVDQYPALPEMPSQSGTVDGAGTGSGSRSEDALHGIQRLQFVGPGDAADALGDSVAQSGVFAGIEVLLVHLRSVTSYAR